MTETTIANGTRVESQGATILRGTVISQVNGLPGFVIVRWDDGQEWEEYVGDLTVIDR